MIKYTTMPNARLLPEDIQVPDVLQKFLSFMSLAPRCLFPSRASPRRRCSVAPPGNCLGQRWRVLRCQEWHSAHGFLFPSPPCLSL